MPRGFVRCRAPVRRHAAFQRGHDQPRPQIRLRLHAEPRRLEAGALRKADRRRTARYPLCELEARRPLPPACDQSSRELSELSPVLAPPEPGFFVSRLLSIETGASRV